MRDFSCKKGPPEHPKFLGLEKWSHVQGYFCKKWDPCLGISGEKVNESDEESHLVQPGVGAQNVESLQICHDKSDSIQIGDHATDTNSLKVTNYPMCLRFLR